jgi:AraC-like DNA-binding protein
VITHYLNLHLALQQPSSTLERESLLLRFLTVLIVRFAGNRNSPQPFRSARRAAKLARDYLADHLEESVSLETLASVANLSPFHLSRVFSEEFEMPPHAFQTQLRVLKARSLILQGWTRPRRDSAIKVTSLATSSDWSALRRDSTSNTARLFKTDSELPLSMTL